MRYALQADRNELIERLSEELKGIEELAPPEWAGYVKTGTHKERPPSQTDWWYKRSAAVLMKVSNRGPIGVSKLRTLYGGKKRRGHKPAEFRRSAGNILRKVLQGLEKAGLLVQQEKGVHKGRVITAKGSSFINQAAVSIVKPQKKPEAKEEKPKAAKKQPAKEDKPKAEAKAKEVKPKAETKAKEKAQAEDKAKEGAAEESKEKVSEDKQHEQK